MRELKSKAANVCTRDKDFYESGISKFTPQQSAAQIAYLPYPEYKTDEWRSQWHGEFEVCDGPRGEPLQDDLHDSMRAFPIRPQNFPGEFTGSADAIGIDGDVCFDRVQRYGAYGYNPNARTSTNNVDWQGVKWGELQDKCFQRNKQRFRPSARVPWDFTPDFNKPEGQSWTQFHEEIRREDLQKKSVEKSAEKKPVGEAPDRSVLGVHNGICQLNVQSGISDPHVHKGTSKPKVYQGISKENVRKGNSTSNCMFLYVSE